MSTRTSYTWNEVIVMEKSKNQTSYDLSYALHHVLENTQHGNQFLKMVGSSNPQLLSLELLEVIDSLINNNSHEDYILYNLWESLIKPSVIEKYISNS